MKYSKPEVAVFASAGRMIQLTMKDDTFFVDSYIILLSILAYEADE